MRGLTGALVVAAGMVMASAAAADSGYLIMKGSKQGQIRGDVTAKGKEDQNSVLAFDYSIPGASARRVQPGVTFTLRWSKATPLLINAATTGEVFSEFKYNNWVPNTLSAVPGNMTLADTLEFSGAKITAIKIHDRTGDSDAVEPVVEMTISYQSMTITHTLGGITAIDDWATK